MIIRNLRKKIYNDKIKLSVDYIDSHGCGELWYLTKFENEKYLTTEVFDGFLIGLLLRAMKLGEDINVEGYISARLLYGIENYFIKAINNMNDNYKIIKIKAKLTDRDLNEFNGVGTSVSGGVDSFYTIQKHIEINNKKYKLTHLALFNVGAFSEFGGKAGQDLFYKIIKQGEIIGKEIDLPVIWLDSNLSDILNEKFVETHTFRNLSAVFILQKLFKTYYYSSGHSLNKFCMDFSDPSNYDLLNASALRGNNLEVFIDGMMENRLDKTKYISEFEVTYKNLNVCLITIDNFVLENNGKIINCSKCFKCIRTLVTLDLLGKLEKYSDVFDIQLYYKNKNKYIAELLYSKYRIKNEFSLEIFKEFKIKKIKIDKVVYLYFLKRIFQGVFNYVKKIYI